VARSLVFLCAKKNFPREYGAYSSLKMATHDYKEASAIARKRRAASIAAFYQTPGWNEADLPNNLTEFALKSGYYTDDELQIIQTEADTILEKIKSKTWTALEVTKAFCKASALAQELTNCLTEVLYPEAFERAKYLDDYLARTGKTVGPLHGLPISLKDCFITAPHPSSMGWQRSPMNLSTKTLFWSPSCVILALFSTSRPMSLLL